MYMVFIVLVIKPKTCFPLARVCDFLYSFFSAQPLVSLNRHPFHGFGYYATGFDFFVVAHVNTVSIELLARILLFKQVFKGLRVMNGRVCHGITSDELAIIIDLACNGSCSHRKTPRSS